MITLLRNANLHAPEPLGVRNLLIGGERILWVGDRLEPLPATLAAAEIDLEGRTVVPGIIDGHAHLTGGGGEAGPASRVPAPFLTHYTKAGVTSAVGVLGTDDTTRSTGDLVITARALQAEGLSAWCHCGGYHVPVATLTGSVRRDIAFVDEIIGVGELAISDHRSSQPTLDEFLRIASDAHVGGLMTGKAGIVHLHVGDGVRGLDLVRRALETSELPARVFNPTHVNRRAALLEEAIEIAARGCYVDITAFDVAPGEEGYSAADAFERYVTSGAPAERVTISSDGGGCLPVFDKDGRVIRMGVGDAGALARTMQELVKRGHALSTVLPAFTSNVATLLRLTAKGRLRPGYDADLLVLDTASTVTDVMARGAWMVRDGAVMHRGMFEPF